MELFIFIVLVLTSILSLAFILERGFALRWNKVLPANVLRAVSGCRTPGDLPMLQRLCEQEPSPLSRLILAIIGHLELPEEDTVRLVETRARHEVHQLERGLVVLEIVTGIAPLLGLVGTIYGLITLFGSMGAAGVADHGRFAQGIALALNATLAGLLIAIPSIVAWSVFTKKVEGLTVEMERVCDEFLRSQHKLRQTKGGTAP